MTTTAYPADALTLSVGILVARLVLGPLMAGHGAQKLFGWFGGHGLKGTGGFFESLGFHPGRLFAGAAAATEVVSGLLVTSGMLGPVGPALMISVMIVATFTVHWKNGVFAQDNGIELPLLFGAGAFALALTGPGLFSLDALFGLEPLWQTGVAVIALAVGVLGGVGNLMLRTPPKAGTAH
jgi:putative oxidoreductase